MKKINIKKCWFECQHRTENEYNEPICIISGESLYRDGADLEDGKTLDDLMIECPL